MHRHSAETESAFGGYNIANIAVPLITTTLNYAYLMLQRREVPMQW